MALPQQAGEPDAHHAVAPHQHDTSLGHHDDSHTGGHGTSVPRRGQYRSHDLIFTTIARDALVGARGSFPSEARAWATRHGPGVVLQRRLAQADRVSLAPLSPLHETPRRAGFAHLAFERAGPRTVVRTALAHSPLRLLTPRNHGHAAWAYTSSFGGGLVDGDHLSLQVDVAPGAAAWVSSQGANRVYRSPSGCRSDVSARVGEDALLAWVPDPTACFTGARYSQTLAFQLAPGASLVLADLITSGRSASGERWAFSHYASTLRVHVGERALVDERWLLDPTHGTLPERLGRFEAMATLLLVGPALATVREALHARITALPVTSRALLIPSSSPLGTQGLLVRAAAMSVEELVRTTRDWLSFLPALLGDDPWARRV
ncbi:urease accessory protein UreD [Myxococcus sp. AM011]|nr:urease accessory protein UreD [Myxococcus sp. AM011]